MDKKSSRSSRQTKQTSQIQFQFVNYDLTKEDKAALKKANPTTEQVLTSILQLTKEGYKLSISWDNYSDCPQAILIGSAPTCSNHGYMISSRASSIEKALAALVYKHLTVFDGVWHDRVQPGHPDDDF